MAASAIGSGTISFGLVTIPVKVYSASRTSESISFNLLHGKCGSRLKQQYICPKDEEVVERGEMIKGYEFAKGQYVTFSEAELKAIEEKSTQTIEITEFVPGSSIDPVYFDKPYYLGPDKHGSKAYSLIARAMEESGRWAVARYTARGRVYLVVLRPFEGGLVMQQLHFANEIRSFDEVPHENVEVRENELKLAMLLADQVSAEAFNPSAYRDEGQEKLKAMIEKKIAGEQITEPVEEESRGEVIDLMEALRASLASSPKKGRAEAAAPERKPAKRAPGRVVEPTKARRKTSK